MCIIGEWSNEKSWKWKVIRKDVLFRKCHAQLLSLSQPRSCHGNYIKSEHTLLSNASEKSSQLHSMQKCTESERIRISNASTQGNSITSYQTHMLCSHHESEQACMSGISHAHPRLYGKHSVKSWINMGNYNLQTLNCPFLACSVGRLDPNIGHSLGFLW